MRNKKKIAVVIAVLTVILICFGGYSFASYKENEKTADFTKDTTDFYEKWKEKYLLKNPYVTDEVQYYVWYSGETFEQNNYETAVTVSEAHGYGMLIAASMAEYDSNAKEIFDGLYRYYRAHLSGIGPNLMAWQQSDNGTAIINTSGADSAADGDMDIAYSLLMADSIWGSNGDINYRQSAVDIINDIMTYEVNQTDWIIQLGDWVYSEQDSQYYSATRASDFIVQYMPVFAKVTNDQRWMNVYDSTYEIINSFTAEYKTGILPDFIVKDETGKFVPAPADFMESEYDGCYYYNSCRTPWRISMDYIINENQNALAFASAINSFIIDSTNGDPWEIKAGYKPDGTPVEDYNDLCFTAPFMVSALCGDNTQWHDAVRDTVVNYGDDVYYGDTIKMLCLIADDGKWIVPGASEKAVKGDVDANGFFNLSDVIMLKNWLVSSENLTEWKNGDLCEDNVIDVFDLCLMRREFQKQA